MLRPLPACYCVHSGFLAEEQHHGVDAVMGLLIVLADRLNPV